MSILIKGLKMPKSCILCPFGNEFGECCVNAELEDANELTHSCPLIELPDHGDLIDRDELIEEAKILGTVTCHQPFDFPYGCNLVEWCKLAKTVIPAERSEE